MVNNHLKAEDNKMAMAWEKAFLEYLEWYKKNNATYIDFVYSAEVGNVIVGGERDGRGQTKGILYLWFT